MFERTKSWIRNELQLDKWMKKKEKEPGGIVMNLALNTSKIALASVSLSPELLRAVEENDVTQMR